MATAAASRPSGPVLSSPNYRPASPTRVKLHAGSPVKSVSVSSSSVSSAGGSKIPVRRSCMCSPTNHPGSFRCSLHKERKETPPAGNTKPTSPPSPPSRRTASPFAQHGPNGSGCSKGMVSPFAHRVPMGSGHWARKALAPSPTVQQLQHRKRAVRFVAGPSRLSAAASSSMAGGRSQ